MALLASEALDFGHRDALDAHAGQGFTHLIELERFNDCRYEFHVYTSTNYKGVADTGLGSSASPTRPEIVALSTVRASWQVLTSTQQQREITPRRASDGLY